MKDSFIFNSYNILGISAESSQKEIKSRINNIGKVLAVDETVSFDYDLYISPAERQPELIKECEARLNDIFDRMVDYFFWFTIKTDVDKDIFRAVRENDLIYIDDLYSSGNVLQKKNAALAMSIVFEKSQKRDDFENALNKWAGLIQDGSFWNNWKKLYKGYDYLDTDIAVIDSFESRVTGIVVEKFFATSELDDVIDAQIVDKYIKVPNESFGKATEPYILKAREIEQKLQDYQSSKALLTYDHVVNYDIQMEVLDLLDEATQMYETIAATSNSKIDHIFDNLWNSFLSLAIFAHNKASRDGDPKIENLEFQKKIIAKISHLSSDSMLNDRIKKNREIAEEMISDLKERQAVEPYYSQLETLAAKVANTSVERQAAIEHNIQDFKLLYSSVMRENLLSYSSISQLLNVLAGMFNMIAVDISNKAQEPLADKFQQLNRTQGADQIAIAIQIKASASSVLDKLKFAKSILEDLKSLHLNDDIKSTISSNYSSVTDTIDTIIQVTGQTSEGQRGVTAASKSSMSTRMDASSTKPTNGSNSSGHGCIIAVVVAIIVIFGIWLLSSSSCSGNNISVTSFSATSTNSDFTATIKNNSSKTYSTVTVKLPVYASQSSSSKIGYATGTTNNMKPGESTTVALNYSGSQTSIYYKPGGTNIEISTS
jgi:hypothetical protein